jgi:hypothetical protein
MVRPAGQAGRLPWQMMVMMSNAERFLSGFEPLDDAPAEPILKPEAGGKIGTMAASLGIGTKKDCDMLDIADTPASEALQPIPNQLGDGWRADIVATKLRLVDRLIAIEDIHTANRWLSIMSRPRPRFHDVAALTRMVGVIERQVAASRVQLQPVEPAVPIPHRDPRDCRRACLPGRDPAGGDRRPGRQGDQCPAGNPRSRGFASALHSDDSGRAAGYRPPAFRNRRHNRCHATARPINQLGDLPTA